jgi:hypothetical protein
MEHERIGENIIESFQLVSLLLDLPGGPPVPVRSASLALAALAVTVAAETDATKRRIARTEQRIVCSY